MQKSATMLLTRPALRGAAPRRASRTIRASEARYAAPAPLAQILLDACTLRSRRGPGLHQQMQPMPKREGGKIMAKPDILIVDGHAYSSQRLCDCAANSWKNGKRAKRGSPCFSNFIPITGHAPNGQLQGGIENRACLTARRLDRVTPSPFLGQSHA